MLIVTDLNKLAKYGFYQGKTKKNDCGFDIWVRDVKISGYKDEYRFSLIVNPFGKAYHTKNIIIQCVNIEKQVWDIEHESDVNHSDFFTFEDEFSTDLLFQMIADGIVKYVPDNKAKVVA